MAGVWRFGIGRLPHAHQLPSQRRSGRSHVRRVRWVVGGTCLHCQEPHKLGRRLTGRTRSKQAQLKWKLSSSTAWPPWHGVVRLSEPRVQGHECRDRQGVSTALVVNGTRGQHRAEPARLELLGRGAPGVRCSTGASPRGTMKWVRVRRRAGSLVLYRVRIRRPRRPRHPHSAA